MSVGITRKGIVEIGCARYSIASVAARNPRDNTRVRRHELINTNEIARLFRIFLILPGLPFVHHAQRIIAQKEQDGHKYVFPLSVLNFIGKIFAITNLFILDELR